MIMNRSFSFIIVRKFSGISWFPKSIDIVGLRTLNDSFNKFMAGDKESRKFFLRFFRKTIKMKFEGLCTLVSFCSLDCLKYQGFAINFDAAKHP